MVQIKSFTFNPFQENTYVLYDESKECVIIDPGCYEFHEKQALLEFISREGLQPVMLLNTHAHIDHVLGNYFVHQTYGLKPVMHTADLNILRAVPAYAPNYGFRYDTSPEPESFLEENDIVRFGNSSLKVLFTPGHSPGSISFYSEEDHFIISGDVLFSGSIGRTDLPGGDFDTLIRSIREKLLVLPAETRVYSGHGPSTSIGAEKRHNPFLT